MSRLRVEKILQIYLKFTITHFFISEGERTVRKMTTNSYLNNRQKVHKIKAQEELSSFINLQLHVIYVRDFLLTFPHLANRRSTYSNLTNAANTFLKF